MDYREGGCGSGIFGLVLLGLALFGAWTLYQRITDDEPGRPRTAAVGNMTATRTSNADSKVADSRSSPTLVAGDDCSGLRGWLDENSDRTAESNAEVDKMTKKGEAGTATRADFEDSIDFYYALAEEQRNSDPPPAAVKLNELMATNWETVAHAGEAYLAGNKSTGDALTRDGAETVRQIVIEDKKVKDHCS